METCTLYLHDNHADGGSNSRFTKVVGAAGTFTLNMPVPQIGRLSFNDRGILLENPSNVAPPGAPTFDQTRPRPLKSASACLGQTADKFNCDTMDCGAEVIRRRLDQEKDSKIRGRFRRDRR